jgi:acyl-CoA synthetase (NDP forming)
LGSEAGLDSLFHPSSIALIGASHSVEKLGGSVLKNLLRFKGRLYPINPKFSALMGVKAYPEFKDIPETVDMTIVIRPAEEVPDILKELKGRSKTAIIVSSGFSEIGEAGLEEEIKSIAKEGGIRLLGPNCMGIYNPYHSLDTLFFTLDRVKRPPKGNVSVISQSGAILTSLLDLLGENRIGVSKALNYGNAADINESDLLRYMAGDEKTCVVVLYMESVEDGREFLREASALSKKKPLVVLKAGKSPAGQSAAYSHTGRLAGSYDIFRFALRQFGIREVGSLDELFDSVKALCCRKPYKGSRVLIVTNGGGSGALAADECMRQGLDVPPLPPQAKSLMASFPEFYGINNPLDLTAMVKDEDYIKALDELMPFYDGFVIIALAGVTGITEELSAKLKEFLGRSGRKPLVVHTAQGIVAKRLKKAMKKSGIPVYDSPEGAVRGIRALLYD